jgi:predicted transposase YdaD
MGIAQAHDHFLKKLLEQPGTAGALLREHLPPEIVAGFADAEPELVPGTFVDPGLRETQSDRLFKVRRRDGGTAYVYCLVEHKSAPDRRIGLQLLGYLSAIWKRLGTQPEHQEKLPLVVPLVIYHGETRWKGPWRFSESLDASQEQISSLLDFPIPVLDVGHVERRRLSSQPHLRGGLLLMRYAMRLPEGEDPVEALARMLEDMRGMSDEFLVSVGFYMFQYVQVAGESMREAIRRGMPEIEEEMLSPAAREKLAEGRALGKAETLLRQLIRKFGPVAPDLQQRVQQASLAELDTFLDRILDAKSIEDVFAPLP